MVRYRQRQGLSQERLAQLVGVSTSTVTNWERGEYSPQHKYRPKLAKALGVSLTELALLLDGAEAVSTPSVNGAVPEWLSLFAKAEQAAETVCVFQAIAVPALLQTRQYAAAIERLGYITVSDADVARLVEMRMARQAALTRQPPLRLRAVIDKSVLGRPVGGRAVLGPQLTICSLRCDTPRSMCGYCATSGPWPPASARSAC